MAGSRSAMAFTFGAVSTGPKQKQGDVSVWWDKNLRRVFHCCSGVNGIALKCGLETLSYPFQIFWSV